MNNIPIDTTLKSKSLPQDGNIGLFDIKNIHQQVKYNEGDDNEAIILTNRIL